MTTEVDLRLAGTKTYSRHYCQRQHRSFRTLAQCIWPRAAWISGDAALALVSYCGAVTTVSLHRSIDDAECSRVHIDRGGCGHACVKHHELIRLVDPGAAEPGERRRRGRSSR